VIGMVGLKTLLRQRSALEAIMKELDNTASLETSEGLHYLRTLTLLVLTEMNIDELEQKKVAH
jgi:ligand-binding sensor domain-containing protein